MLMKLELNLLEKVFALLFLAPVSRSSVLALFYLFLLSLSRYVSSLQNQKFKKIGMDMGEFDQLEGMDTQEPFWKIDQSSCAGVVGEIRPKAACCIKAVVGNFFLLNVVVFLSFNFFFLLLLLQCYVCNTCIIIHNIHVQSMTQNAATSLTLPTSSAKFSNSVQNVNLC